MTEFLIANMAPIMFAALVVFLLLADAQRRVASRHRVDRRPVKTRHRCQPDAAYRFMSFG